MHTIIIDDEQQIRDGLKIMLQAHPEVKVIAEAGDVDTAREQIEQHRPDLLFLDIKLKDKTGFQLLDALDYKSFKVIFITAFDEFAIRAFKYNAFDYLLKPIMLDELGDTLQRLQESDVTYDRHVASVASPTQQDRLVVKTTNEVHLLDIERIVRCEADQGYAHIFLEDGRRIVSAKPLKEYQGLLPDATFARIHQSHLVHLQHVDTYLKEGKVIMKDGTSLPVSVRKRQQVRDLLSGMNRGR